MKRNRIRVIAIDAKNRKLYETTILTLADMQALVGGYIERGVSLTNDDDVFVDEEGLLKDNQYAFFINNQFLVGNGFIIGKPDRRYGNSTHAKSSIEELEVVFFERTHGVSFKRVPHETTQKEDL